MILMVLMLEKFGFIPDNINIGGATGSGNTINLLGGGRKNIEFRTMA